MVVEKIKPLIMALWNGDQDGDALTKHTTLDQALLKSYENYNKNRINKIYDNFNKIFVDLFMYFHVKC